MLFTKISFISLDYAEALALLFCPSFGVLKVYLIPSRASCLRNLYNVNCQVL